LVWSDRKDVPLSSIRRRAFHKDGDFLNSKFSNLELLPKSMSEGSEGEGTEGAGTAPEIPEPELHELF